MHQFLLLTLPQGTYSGNPDHSDDSCTRGTYSWGRLVTLFDFIPPQNNSATASAEIPPPTPGNSSSRVTSNSLDSSAIRPVSGSSSHIPTPGPTSAASLVPPLTSAPVPTVSASAEGGSQSASDARTRTLVVSDDNLSSQNVSSSALMVPANSVASGSSAGPSNSNDAADSGSTSNDPSTSEGPQPNSARAKRPRRTATKKAPQPKKTTASK